MRGPWGNGGHLGSQGSQGARPTRRGKGRTVGIGQWRRVDVAKCLKSTGDGLVTTSSHVYAQTMYHMYIVCQSVALTNITGIMFYCIICFRRINHLVVKNHLHSSSGVREVVPSTRRIF